MPRRWAARARLAGALAGCFLAAGCTTWSESFNEVEYRLSRQQYPEALQAIERSGDAVHDPLLYELNKAMALRMAGDYSASNQSFEAAKTYIEKYSAISLREQAGTFIINDATRAYAGEEHEQVLVHLYEALNYLALGNEDSARVEALQVDVVLRQQAAGTSSSGYVEDALARYLNGMIYEDEGEWSDALIAYRKSYEAFRVYRGRYGVDVPQALKVDLLRLTQYLGLNDEMRRYRQEFGIDQWTDQATWRQQGELVFFLHNGLAPIKLEQAATILDPNSGHIVRIALPYYATRGPLVHRARVTVGQTIVESEVYEDIQAIATQVLDAKLPVITARAVARAVVKAKVAKAARQQNRNNDALASAIIGLGAEIVGVLTERADTRSWATLPHDIQIARMTLNPGTYAVKIDLLGSGDAVVASFDLRDVVIRPGHKTYVSRHYLASHAIVPRRPP